MKYSFLPFTRNWKTLDLDSCRPWKEIQRQLERKWGLNGWCTVSKGQGCFLVAFWAHNKTRIQDSDKVSDSDQILVARRPIPWSFCERKRNQKASAPKLFLKRFETFPEATETEEESRIQAMMQQEALNQERYYRASLQKRTEQESREYSDSVFQKAADPDYECRACHRKGLHWEPACPWALYQDPEFQPLHKPKPTTGIPNSLLHVLRKEKSDSDQVLQKTKQGELAYWVPLEKPLFKKQATE